MDFKKNILIMIPTLNIAGAEKFVVDLAINLDKSKFNIYVGTLYKSKNNYYEGLLKKNNIQIVDFYAKNKFKILKNINKYFKNNKIDILHTNLNTILYTMFFAKKYKIQKRIFTFHSTADRIDSKLKKKLYKFAFKKLDFVPVAISDYIKQTVKNEFKIELDKIECIYNGVDINKFVKTEKNENDVCTLINVGTLYYIKNHALLINSVKKLIDKGYSLRLILLGDGKLKEELINLTNALGLSNIVEFKGVVNNVSYYLEQADIYCCTSLVEGLPISVLEAMSCGLPIISTKAGGVVDIVKNEYNGYICDTFDVDEYTSLIEKLILDKKMKFDMGKKSRLFVEKLSIEYCAKNYEKVYLNK